MSDEKLNDFLSRHQIPWQFNLSRTNWWGDQFERMVGLVKGARGEENHWKRPADL